MSLVTKLAEAKVKAPSGYDQWVAGLPAEEREALITAAADTNIPHRVLLDIVRSEGAVVGRDRLTSWRRAHGFPH